METTMTADRTVHVVDDDAAVRRSLERLLHSANHACISYPTPAAFLDAAPELPGGCVLLDVRMPGMDGLELQDRLNKLGVKLPVIVMTGQGDIQTAVQAMKAGAVDFIEKPFDENALLGAIEVALAQAAGHTDRTRAATEAARRIATLSPRERQVLDALVAGRPNKQIAFDLGLSVRTVEVHRAHMMERLGARQLAEAVRLAIMAQLASGDGLDQARVG
jgi:two-component system, LuxR family, response regulator FixJ